MKKNNISGWKDVFSFTLIQTLKNKTFIVTFILLLGLSVLSMPIINMIKASSEESDAPNPIQKVYVYNNTDLSGVDFNGLLKDQRLSHITFENRSDDYNQVLDLIENQEHNSIVLSLQYADGAYLLDFKNASSGPVNDKSLLQLVPAVSKQFDAFKMEALGVTEEQSAILHAEVTSLVSMADVNGNIIVKENTAISGAEYWFIYGILFFVLMVNSIANGQIASSIASEKSSRVVEYLLITVRPLALIVGKVIAMLCAVLLQMLTLITMLFVSNKVSAMMSDGPSVMEQYLPKDLFQNINIINIFLCIALVILGLIFYATLAGLAGSTVSKMEELSEGMTLFSVVNMVGAYVGLAAANTMMASSENAFVLFSMLFPLSSPFVLPGAILVGKASPLIAGIAIILLMASVALLFRFVASVYENLIFHTGNKIKLKDLIKMSKAA